MSTTMLPLPLSMLVRPSWSSQSFHLLRDQLILTQNCSDDILADQEAFGEVALLLWDANSRVRQAAALHVFEDSFVVQDDKSDAQRRLEDLEQLYTLFEECCPSIEDLDPEIAVAYLIDSFFFRLDCLRVSEGSSRERISLLGILSVLMRMESSYLLLLTFFLLVTRLLNR